MELIQQVYLDLFIILHQMILPLFENPVILSYISIFLIASFLSWKNYQWLRRQPFFLQKNQIHIMPGLRFVLELFLLGFLLWFLLVHIKTLHLI